MTELNRYKERRLERVRSLEGQRQEEEARDPGRACPNCGSRIGEDWEFCPVCGIPLVPWCTFCGAELPPGAAECPECGMPRKGTVCPRCGTLNARSFCRNCNEPLTRAARREVERALEDPLFLRAAELAVKLAEDFSEPDTSAPAELPPDILRLKELLSAVKFGSPQSPQKDTPAPVESAPAATVRSRSREEMRAEYERMKAELNSILGRMTPPPGSTPQQQRNYYSARNIPVLKKIRVKVAWICNFCGCWHNDPDECVRPDLKGRWVYDDKIVIEHKEL